METKDTLIKVWNWDGNRVWGENRGMYVPIAEYEQWIAVRNDARELIAIIVSDTALRSESDTSDCFVGTNNVRHRVLNVGMEAEGLCRLEIAPYREASH